MNYQLIAPLNTELTPIEQILINRGFGLENIEHYFNTTDEDICSPLLLDNIKEGAQILIKHIANEDDTLIVVDSDCDGYTSAAFIINYLFDLFPAYVQNHISYLIHSEKIHGIEMDKIPSTVKLIIAPDSASNQYEEHEKLKNIGVDVLVLDHHEAEYQSPHACVINNQLCNYPTKSLSGVGIVYKFCSYIDSLLNVSYAEKYLDLVALGQIADMVDLKAFETKHLIQKGLKKISNPYFERMVEKNSYQLGKGLTPIGIAFYVAPYVNAMIRTGDIYEKTILFEAMLNHKAHKMIPSTKRGEKGKEEELVEQACRACTNVKNKQTKMRDEALQKIEALIEQKSLLNNKVLVIKLDESYSIEKSLRGLIANQLMAKYQRPVMILSKTCGENETVLWEGSARGYEKSRLHNFKDFLSNSGLVLYSQGHQNAFGIGVEDKEFLNFINYLNTSLADFDFSPVYKVDFIFNALDFNANDILKITDLESYWGQGIDEPLIAVENIKITKDNIILMSAEKNPTLKITLPNGTSLIKFKSSQEEYENLATDIGCITINAVGRAERNEWNGRISPQILIEEYEIVSKQEWYF